MSVAEATNLRVGSRWTGGRTCHKAGYVMLWAPVTREQAKASTCSNT